MSYILEALKMSEQARREAAPPSAPSLLPPAGTDEKEPDRAWPRYLLIAALLLVNIAAIALWQRPVDKEVAAAALRPPAVEATPAAAPAPAVVSVPAVVSAPAAASAPAPLPQAAPLAPAPPSQPAARIEPPATVAEPSPPRPSVIEARAEPSPVPAPEAKPAPAVAASPRPVASAKAETAPGAQSNDNLPPSIEKQLPALALSGFIQDADQNNIVIVNDKLVREGDEAAPGVKLEKILPDGVIFNFKGYRFKR